MAQVCVYSLLWGSILLYYISSQIFIIGSECDNIERTPTGLSSTTSLELDYLVRPASVPKLKSHEQSSNL